MQLDCGPTDDINKLLLEICKKHDLRKRVCMPGEGFVERWDIEAAANSVIGAFRSRKIYDCFLDKDTLMIE